jgi:predicted Zn-dependent protease
MLFRIAVNIGLILLAAPLLIAQESRNTGTTLSGQISGQVRYAEGGQPAFNVLVSCDSFNSGRVGQEMTDRSGRFRFSNLGPSQYTVTVRVAGYVEERQTVELLTSPSANLQFQLRADGSSSPASSGSSSGSKVLDPNVPAPAKKEFDQAATLLATEKKEDLEKSVPHLEKAVTIYPKFVQAQLMLGTVYMDLGQLDKAEPALKRTLELDPKAANALFALGELYLRQKKYEQAEKVMQDGLAIETRSAQAHLTLARVYWDKVAGVKEEAQWRPPLEKSYEEVKQALVLDANLAAAHLLKGNLLFKVRRAEDALHEFEEYLRLDPKGQFAEQTRAYAEKIKKALAEQKKP